MKELLVLKAIQIGGQQNMNFHSYPATYLGPISLKVKDLDRSLTFYKEIIGFQGEKLSEKKAYLSVDGKTPFLILEQPDDVTAKQPRTTGLYHFAILLPNRKELGKFLLHLLQKQYPIQGASDHLVSEAIYFADPDGNGIEVYRDRPAEKWSWKGQQVEMATVPMDAEGVLAEANDEAWMGLPIGTVLGHIHLHVSDLQESEKFYCGALGFDLVSKYGHQAYFLSSNRYHHHIGMNTWNGVGAPAPDENSVGLKWFSIVYPTLAARNNAVENLKNLGAEVSEQDGVVLTKDPSGINIQLWFQNK
jgi:catechol 2,3-dioxygenase